MGEQTYDVAIIGGGPAGSTAGSLLRKYGPEVSVVILEKERFPRDHVGESQLPPIGAILREMGCWDAVEQADFPIKIGATYRWGASAELWDLEFLPVQTKSDAAPVATNCLLEIVINAVLVVAAAAGIGSTVLVARLLDMLFKHSSQRTT